MAIGLAPPGREAMARAWLAGGNWRQWVVFGLAFVAYYVLQFTLNGVTYNLPGNNGTNNINTMHGGPNAFNTKVWAGASCAN